MKKLLIFIIATIILIPFAGMAQEFQRFTADNSGLAYNMVYCIAAPACNHFRYYQLRKQARDELNPDYESEHTDHVS